MMLATSTLWIRTPMYAAAEVLSRDFNVAPSPDREIRMAVTIPPELYRRKQAYRTFAKALEAIRAYRDATEMDYPGAQAAGYYALAAELAPLINRGDLAFEFERMAQEAMVRVASAKPMRRRPKTGPRQPRIPKDSPLRPNRTPDDQPRKNR